MIGVEDALYTYEYDKYFKILPAINNWDRDSKRIKNGIRVQDGFSYTSNNNIEWMTGAELQAWIDANRKKIGSI
jgi:hypothetical protein